MSNFNKLYKKSAMVISFFICAQSVLAQSLFDAVKSGKVESVEATLYQTYGAGINEVDENGDSPLHYAVISANPAIVDLLIAWRADVNLVNFDNESPLLMTARIASTLWGALKLLREFCHITDSLINAGANLDIQNWQGNTALHYAIADWSYPILVSLVNAQASLNIQNNLGNTPLHLVNYFPQTDVLLQARRGTDEAADLEIRNNDDERVFDHLLKNIRHPAVVEFLNEARERQNYVSHSLAWQTLINCEAKEKEKGFWRQALRIWTHFLPTFMHSDRETRFHQTVLENSNIHDLDENGQSLLNAYLDLVGSKNTAKHERNVYIKAILRLIETNADINHKFNNLTPLDRALRYKLRDVAQALLDRGAQFNEENLTKIAALFGDDSPQFEMARTLFTSRQKRA